MRILLPKEKVTIISYGKHKPGEVIHTSEGQCLILASCADECASHHVPNNIFWRGLYNIVKGNYEIVFEGAKAYMEFKSSLPEWFVKFWFGWKKNKEANEYQGWKDYD